jgi:pyruvate formate lyase activating enzyme
MYREKKCVHRYYRCANACPHNAIQIKDGKNPSLQFNRSMCESCDNMKCVNACLNEALQIAGQFYTVDDLMQILIRDQEFWGSNGGVTFGGGEPTFQSEFLLAVLAECRSCYIHTTVETSAYTNINFLTKVLKWTDAMFIDIKHTDSAAHRFGTGVDNKLILQNIEEVARCDWDGRLVIRIPIVPGYNDTIDNLQNTAAFMTKLSLKEVNLLPFHRLGHSKYEQLGLRYEHAQTLPPSQEALSSYKRIFDKAGLQCFIGSEIPF